MTDRDEVFLPGLGFSINAARRRGSRRPHRGSLPLQRREREVSWTRGEGRVGRLPPGTDYMKRIPRDHLLVGGLHSTPEGHGLNP